MKISDWNIPPQSTPEKPFAPFDHLRASETYRIYRTTSRFQRYDVTAPGGRIVACTRTMWGAFRAINRHRDARRAVRGDKWWERPYVNVDPTRD